jgi:hypothetical protein
MIKIKFLHPGLLLALLSCLGGRVLAQNGQNMKVHFVAPAAVINANFPGHTNVIGIALPTGYDIVEVTAANAAAFTNAAPPRLLYVYQQLQAGTPLRQRVNEVQYISRDSVQVNYFLVDDRTGISNTASGNFLAVRIPITLTDPATDGLFHVWPTGNGFSVGAAFQGRVRLGEYQLEHNQFPRTGGLTAIQEVVLHESFHTQLVNRWTKWNGYITYGADQSHSTREIMGDQEAALNEGAGTFYGFTINNQGLTALDNYFTNAGYRYFLEGRSVCAGYPELYNVSARQRREEGGATLWDYRWSDVPGFFLMFNENNATAFFANYWRNAFDNRDTAMSFLNHTFHAMWRDTLKRYLTYAINRLALKMESYAATPAGQADATKTSSMFPFALLDLITHFGMSQTEYQEDYRRNYPDREPRAFTQYWTHRAAVRQLVQADMTASPIRFAEAVRRIRDYFRAPATILTP